MMCVKPGTLEKYVQAFEEAGISYLHIDIMDGVFTPNFALGTDYVKELRGMTSIPLDIHLMAVQPEDKLAWFDMRPGEIVSIHYESTRHVQRALQKIRDAGAKPMIALDPATPLSALEYVLGDIDGVLLMMVNPGFAGQRLIPAMLGKISDLRAYLDAKGYGGIEIEVDGNVSFENAAKMRGKGATLFVAGSSSVFAQDLDVESAVHTLYQAIRGGNI